MAEPVAPEHDCPPCPACKMPLGTPILGAECERFYGPFNSTIFCPSCGTGWVGTPEELEQANRSWAAYEAEMAKEGR